MYIVKNKTIKIKFALSLKMVSVHDSNLNSVRLSGRALEQKYKEKDFYKYQNCGGNLSIVSIPTLTISKKTVVY